MPYQPGGANKIFGLGLARTGTTSLHHAMGRLGINSAPSSARLIDGLDGDFLHSYDAFFDNPIPFLRAELHELFPDARFIVTWRPLDTWLPSMEWLFGPGLTRLTPELRSLGDRVHRQVYGIDHFDATRLSTIHQEHYESLRIWAAGRTDVLWLDQSRGLSWQPICTFLDVPVPRSSFPISNTAQRTASKLSQRLSAARWSRLHRRLIAARRQARER